MKQDGKDSSQILCCHLIWASKFSYSFVCSSLSWLPLKRTEWIAIVWVFLFYIFCNWGCVTVENTPLLLNLLLWLFNFVVQMHTHKCIQISRKKFVMQCGKAFLNSGFKPRDKNVKYFNVNITFPKLLFWVSLRLLFCLVQWLIWFHYALYHCLIQLTLTENLKPQDNVRKRR